MPSLLFPAQLERFHTGGFVIVRAMVDVAETTSCERRRDRIPEVASHLLDRLDAFDYHGGAARPRDRQHDARPRPHLRAARQRPGCALDNVQDAAVKAAGLRFATGGQHFTSRPFVPKVA